MDISQFAKLWSPIIGGVLMAVLSAYVNYQNGDGLITADEWIQIAIQGSSVFVVWATANLPQWPRMKTYVMAAMVVLNLLVSAIVDGLTFLEIMNIAIACLSALGVYQIPNKVKASNVAIIGTDDMR